MQQRFYILPILLLIGFSRHVYYYGMFDIIEEYMDYNVNIAAFSDHCVSIGIDESMIIDYTMFDDRNVITSNGSKTQLARLVTCLLEYIDHYHSVCSQDLPHPTYPVDEESKQTVDYSYISTESNWKNLDITYSDKSIGFSSRNRSSKEKTRVVFLLYALDLYTAFVC